MTELTQERGSGFFIVSEANGSLSREIITIDSGANAALLVGTVLGKISATGKYLPTVHTAMDGSQTAVAVLYEQLAASEEDITAVAIVRQAEVDGGELVWQDGDNDGQIATHVTELATVGIIVRPAGVTSI